MAINRRHVLVAAAAGLCLPDAAGAADDEPPLIHEDYALARQRFQTHLLKRGPAPDPAQPLTPARRAADPLQVRLAGPRRLDSNAADPHDPRPAVLFLHGGNALWQGHWDLARPYVEAGYIAMMPALRARTACPAISPASTTRRRMCLPRRKSCVRNPASTRRDCSLPGTASAVR